MPRQTKSSRNTYQKKRNPGKTPEPSWPKGKQRRKKGSRRIFAVQKHDATRLHYDLRLEIGDALASWAVPKGFPFKTGEKHLAIKVEDHPLDYAAFEGVIPEGYGAGTVLLWDTGAFEVEEASPEEALEAGKIVLQLQGEKLNGQWTLIRTRGGSDEKENWLLLKSRESTKPVSKKEDNRSVASGKSIQEITSENKASKNNRTAKQEKKLPKAKAGFVAPMKPFFSESLPKNADDWLYEIKFDGIRAIAVKKGNEVQFYSRNHRIITGDYPGIRDAVSSLSADEAVLDGEIVALDPNGVSSFQLLQNRGKPGTSGEPPLFCYFFDILQLNGRNTSELPVEERQELLYQALKDRADPIRLSESIRAEPKAFLEQARKLGLEGVIAKKPGSRYHPGKRSRDWLKIKVVHQQEFVIGGYTPPQGSRKHFGSLLLGYYKNKKLVFAGKVGTGFSDKLLREAIERFKPLQTRESPFEELPTGKNRWGVGLTPALLRKCTWLKPKLVCEVKFSEWTSDGILRHPVFLGFRHDKAPSSVKREEPGT